MKLPVCPGVLAIWVGFFLLVALIIFVLATSANSSNAKREEAVVLDALQRYAVGQELDFNNAPQAFWDAVRFRKHSSGAPGAWEDDQTALKLHIAEMSSLLADEGDISWEAASTLGELWRQFGRHHRAKTVPKSAFVDMATSHLRRIAAAFSQSPGAAKLPSKARVMAILQDTCMTAIISALTHAHAAGVNEQNVASKIYRLMGVNSGSFASTFETKIFPSVPNQGGAYGGKTGAVDDVFLSGKTYVATVYR